MLQTYFGVGAGATGNQPTPDERDEFMAENMLLGMRTYAEFSGKLRERPRPILEYAIVDELVRRASGESIAARLREEIEHKFNAIRTDNPDMRSWEAEAERVHRDVSRDVGGHMESGEGVGPRGAEVRAAAARLTAEFLGRSGERSLSERFYRRLDHVEKGGFDYTVRLIELVKDQIEVVGEGVISRLSRAQDEYQRLAGEQINTLFAEAKSRLASGAQKRNASFAETYLDQCREALQPYADYRLRALACEEAIKLLTDISGHLGQKVGTEERTAAVRWSGLIGEFQAGYDTVRATLTLLEDDVRRVSDAVNRPEAGMYLLVKGAGAGDLKVCADEAKTWARFLDAEGGRRALFDKLRTNEGQMELLNRLRTVAANHLQLHEARIPPVTDALRQMQRDDPNKLRELLTRMAARAMPWIQASFDAFKPSGEQYKLLIAVDRAAEFERDFGGLIREVIPPLGIQGVGYADSGVPGRIVCYCEVAGVPLDVLTQLRSEWRQAYRKQDGAHDAFPLNNHVDRLRFPDPVAPRTYDIERLSERMRLFLKGVGYGLLTRDPGGASAASGPPPSYRIDMGGGDRQQLGSERTIRRLEFQPNHQERLESLIARFEADFTPAKVLAAQVIFEHMANRAYAKRRELDANGREGRYGGLGHHAAVSILDQLNRHFEALNELPLELSDADAARERLRARLDQFTRVVRNSVSDLDALEANQDESDLPELRATDKRQADPAKFNDAVLLGLASAEPAVPPPPVSLAGAPPPPPPAGPFYIFQGLGQRGPLALAALQAEIAAGVVHAETQIYDQQRPQDGWRAVNLHPAFAASFAPPPPVGGGFPDPVTRSVNGSEVFYVTVSGQQRGPMNGEKLHGELLAGLLQPTTKIYSRPAHAGLGWRSAAEHPATAEWFDVPPPPPE